MIDMKPRVTTGSPERDVPADLDVIVIGGGQAGLAVGHALKQRDVRFIILDDRARTGDSWRSRWESLRLFTPARYDALPGMRFPAPPGTFPTRDQMADYLEDYARHFELPIHHSVRADGLWPAGEGELGYVVTAGERRYVAPQVVVATGAFQQPRIPVLASHIKRSIRQFHAGEYSTPSMLQDGPVLVVGAGNSGAEIAMEAVRSHRTVLVGRHPGHLPIALDGRLAQVVDHGIWFMVNNVMTLRTPIGRKVAAGIRAGHSGPIERIRPKDLEKAGVERIELRLTGVRNGLPMLADGRVVDVANIIWCTGFRFDFRWIHLPVFDEDGQPMHDRGVVPSSPGLYFLGLPFIYALSSVLVGGVGRDAAYITDRIGARVRIG
jgi:putative flavoprotein involved in K+ transport